MTQASKPGILCDDDSTTYARLLESKTPEITTLVHFSAASSAVSFRTLQRLPPLGAEGSLPAAAEAVSLLARCGTPEGVPFQSGLHRSRNCYRRVAHVCRPFIYGFGFAANPAARVP